MHIIKFSSVSSGRCKDSILEFILRIRGKKKKRRQLGLVSLFDIFGVLEAVSAKAR